MPEPRRIALPLNADTVRELHAGDTVLLSGVVVTGRDRAHQWMKEIFLSDQHQPTPDEKHLHDQLKVFLQNGAIFHCGPVVAGLETGEYAFISAGPTTSIREEPYQADILRHFHVRAVIGKGGMGARTLQACREEPAVYLHAVGGAGALAAQCVQRVLEVFQLEFGVPEAMWVVEMRDLPLVVTMDSHGRSLHDEIETASNEIFNSLLNTGEENIEANG
jgi:fumarate hydratase class I